MKTLFLSVIYGVLNVVVMPTEGQVWPMPQSFVTEDTFFSIIPEEFTFFIAHCKCDVLVEAIERYKSITFISDCSRVSGSESNQSYNLHPRSIGQIFNLTIEVTDRCDRYPYEGMDESYLLKINDRRLPGKAILTSSTVWGALRGLETFSQLVYMPEQGMFTINTTTILDYPRFSFRGLLLDTSRHFLSVPTIMKNIDAMAYSKMNTYHWHIVDDPSFPYVSKTFPQMSKKGAYNLKTHVYTQKDVADVIEYARLRGVRVVVEFDTPGHTLSWGKSQPNLLTQCYKGPKFGPIDPTKEDNFVFIREFFTEVAEVFPDDTIHLGGDEVNFDCWASNTRIRRFMEKHGFGTDYKKLEQYYIERLMDIVKSVNKSSIVWQEVFDNGGKVNQDTIIHVWLDGYKEELGRVTAAGQRAILSACWYLNYEGYGTDWIPFYKCDPHDFVGSPEQKELVLGGVSCMWGEYVDGSNVIARTWPRTSVVAERLWSSATLTDTGKAKSRLEEFRCKMVKRGIKMEPVNGPGFCECDYLY